MLVNSPKTPRMDPIRNPYAPGAGTPPPELAGRDELRETARIALERSRIGRPGRSIIMVGLRGVGKTVLLDRILADAEERGISTLRIEAPENRSLPSTLAPKLRLALLRLSNRDAAKQLAQRALRGLAGFVGALKVKYQDIEVGLDFEPEPGLADNGDLEADLQDLFEAVGAAAKADGTCVALFVDEIQYVREDELAALITALHRTSQRQLPVVMVGAGLPQVRVEDSAARSHTPRDCSTSRKSGRFLSTTPGSRSPSLPWTKGSRYSLTRSMPSSPGLKATHTSCRSGESASGTSPTALRLRSPMSR